MSPASSSIQTRSTFESALQQSSFTLYPHFLPFSSAVPAPVVSCRRPNSPCRRPFFSKNTTSCLPSRPFPPPGKLPNRCVLTIRLPDGRHESGCSSPGTASPVACSTPSRLYTRSTRRRIAVPACGDTAETTNNEPSPRQDIRVRWSSSGEIPTEDVEAAEGACAAAFPNEPWNWVCLEPHPTFIGASKW